MHVSLAFCCAGVSVLRPPWAVRMMDPKGRAVASAGSPQGQQAAQGISVPCHSWEGGGVRPVVTLLPAQGLALGAAMSTGTRTGVGASSSSSTEGPCSLQPRGVVSPSAHPQSSCRPPVQTEVACPIAGSSKCLGPHIATKLCGAPGKSPVSPSPRVPQPC